ncbi:MAG: O-methyltransferase [Paracoccaceae bacterium]
MASFDSINYSLRPSKTIQRQLVFDGIRMLKIHLNLDQQVFVGFGSIWFTDFVMAHNQLLIKDMYSIESDDIGFRRALFNAPYSTVSVCHGHSSAILPELNEIPEIRGRPWLVWLDYDYLFDESVRDDIRTVIERAPENTILLITFNGVEGKYGVSADRPDRLREIFGDLVPDDLSRRACKGERMQETLAEFALGAMASLTSELSRPGGFTPAFRVIYRDTTPMVTVGGVLPALGAAAISDDFVGKEEWPCLIDEPIIAPHLTVREATVLQSLLPSDSNLSRDAVRELGFDLEPEQIQAFQKYYKQYPAFAQIVT